MISMPLTISGSILEFTFGVKQSLSFRKNKVGVKTNYVCSISADIRIENESVIFEKTGNFVEQVHHSFMSFKNVRRILF